MNEIVQVAALILIMFGLGFIVGGLIDLAMDRRLSEREPTAKFLRGFKYGDAVTLASDPVATYPALVLTSRIAYPDSPVPVEFVTVMYLVGGMEITGETMASIWRKVDA